MATVEELMKGIRYKEGDILSFDEVKYKIQKAIANQEVLANQPNISKTESAKHTFAMSVLETLLGQF